ncbi:MAG: cytidine deaminase [Holophagaceae bacterium]|nr:cytidine deaminase [Holophagaceae bacterium]
MATWRIETPEWEMLVEAAWRAWECAYAPYSRFHVGAALYLENKAIVMGCNVENATYPMTLCAERTALCSAVAQHGLKPGQLVALAIVTEAELLTPPCGACRQALAEFSDDLPILIGNRNERKLFQLDKLLPEAFTARNLRQNHSESS